MVDYQTLSIVFTGLSISIAAFYYISTLRNTRKNQELTLETRQAQMYMQIYSESHNDPSFIDAMTIVNELEIHTYEEFQRAREDEKVKKALSRVGMFYEGLGVLVKESYVSIRLVALLITGLTRSWWEGIYKPWIEDGRVKMKFRRWMSEAEYLYDELMKYIEEHPELKT